MKGQSFLARMGFALAGIRIVFRREQSFRIQCLLGLVAAAVTAALRPGWAWAALVALAVGLVLALELINGALEYLIDRVHPEIHDEIKHAKDAAAGAVLVGSFFGALVGLAMVLDWLL
ncbi:MAG: undecaprenol kinase [Sphingomonadales bacterium]|nr:undecaprenol kinase [Sphingomonadales bacterium]MEA3045516.1 undecaprenol kinase [Sphingomonadales bacterium]MEA3047459.1 undecaprenol kinase [Sphingomonadales bacterium]